MKLKTFDLQLFASLGTYDPKKVIVSFGGVELEGFAEDSIVEISPMGEGTTSVVGCHGDVVRSISPDKRHEITTKLLQSSSSNDYLTTIYARDNQQGDGVLPLIIKDLSGRTTFYDSLAWITKNPKVGRGKDASDGSLEWIFHTASGNLFVGGHD